MSTYRQAVEKLAEAQPQFRTDYRCSAQGCPNMGGIGGRIGVDRSGACWYHFQAEALQWPEVTRQILSDDRMRDGGATRGSMFGQQDTPGQKEMRKRLKDGRASNVLDAGAEA